jgi:hypothetical protein
VLGMPVRWQLPFILDGLRCPSAPAMIAKIASCAQLASMYMLGKIEMIPSAL